MTNPSLCSDWRCWLVVMGLIQWLQGGWVFMNLFILADEPLGALLSTQMATAFSQGFIFILAEEFAMFLFHVMASACTGFALTVHLSNVSPCTKLIHYEHNSIIEKNSSNMNKSKRRKIYKSTDFLLNNLHWNGARFTLYNSTVQLLFSSIFLSFLLSPAHMVSF